METLTFAIGLLARLGLLVAIPVALALVVGLVMLVARGLGRAREKAIGLERVDGLVFKKDAWYAPGHTWLSKGGEAVRIGVDDLARRLLSAPTEVELPVPGQQLQKGQVVAVFRSADRRVEITAPADGVVAMVNESLAREPGLVARDSYAKGWLFEMRPSDTRYTELPRGESALGWLRQEQARLANLVERELGIAAADGGELVVPAPSCMPGAKWDELIRNFLRG